MIKQKLKKVQFLGSESEIEFQFLVSQTVNMCQFFLKPETDKRVQFLSPEIDIDLQQNFFSQRLEKCGSFWGQIPYFMGEWNYIKFPTL